MKYGILQVTGNIHWGVLKRHWCNISFYGELQETFIFLDGSQLIWFLNLSLCLWYLSLCIVYSNIRGTWLCAEDYKSWIFIWLKLIVLHLQKRIWICLFLQMKGGWAIQHLFIKFVLLCLETSPKPGVLLHMTCSVLETLSALLSLATLATVFCELRFLEQI